jgi:rhomboid protease GluP
MPILTAPETPPAGRVFEVRYGPEKPRRFSDPWPNNLELAGAGQVIVTPDSVVFTDGKHARKPERRTFAMGDIANTGVATDGSIIVVRTRDDDREVYLWMASPDDARALMELLPQTTTPEFVEREKQHQKFRENLKALAPRPRVTPAIVGINVAVFVVMVALGAGMSALNLQVHLLFGANYGPLTWNGQEWRLLASAFIHFGLIHLLFNMFALYNGGRLIESLFGSARFAAIYLLSALAGGVVSGWWDPTRMSAGASGAVFGVYGALLAFFARRPRDIPVDILKSVSMGAGSLLVYSLAFGFALEYVPRAPRVDNSAHIGGLIAGVISGYLLARPFEPAARAVARPWHVAAVVAGICAVLVMLASFIKV